MSAAVILSDVAELVMGQSPPSTCYNGSGVGLPFFQGKTDFGATYPTPRIYCSEPKKLAEEGDILMSVRAPVGATNLCKSQSCIGRGIAAIRASGIDRDFLYFYLKEIEAYIDSLGSGAIFKAINKSQLAELPINDAGIPLPEQKKIAHVLSMVQRALEAQERIILTTIELKKALMQKLFTEGLRHEPQKQTDIGPIPESWEVMRLSDVCRFQSGGTPSKQNPEFWQGSIPWVSPKDMKRPRLDDVTDHISQEALESGSKLAPAGSVFVVVRGMILAKTVPVALATVPMAINQDMKAIIPGPKLRSDFLLYSLEALRENLFKKVGRSGHGTCTLMGHEVAAFKIPLPDMQSQEDIAWAIQNLERKRELHEQKRTSIQALFSTLLHELMTAKTRVNQLILNTELIP
jgi:type I restriction enzyme S subunit